MDHREARLDRADERDIRAQFDPMAAGEASIDDIPIVTIDLGAYPDISPAVFACHRMRLSFDETEGATVTPDVDATAGTIYVANLTDVVPEIGAKWLATPTEGGKLVMAYTGPKKAGT